MQGGAPFKPGERIPGTRWTVVREATPIQLPGRMRHRILVRCVCGREVVHRVDRFENDPKMPLGCRSPRCRHIDQVAKEIRDLEWPVSKEQFEEAVQGMLADTRIFMAEE